MHSRFWQREPRTTALIVLIDVICYVACSRRRVNKAAVKRHGMNQRSFIRSFIRSFHLFVRSFVHLIFHSSLFRSFVSVDRLFCSLCRSFISFVHVVCLFMRLVRFVCSLSLHSFILFTFQSFRGRFLFSPFLSELFILSLEHLSLSSSSDSEFSTSERQSEESFATCKVYLRNYTSLNCFANPSK